MVQVVRCTLTILDCMRQLLSDRPIEIAIYCVADIVDVEIIANEQFELDTS